MIISELIARLQEMQERHGDLYISVNDYEDNHCDVTSVDHPSLDERAEFIVRYDVTDPDFDYIVIRL